MSLLPSGKGKCDNASCGQIEESTSILLFIIVNDVDTDTGEVEVLNFCRRNGCADRVIAAGQSASVKKVKARGRSTTARK